MVVLDAARKEALRRELTALLGEGSVLSEPEELLVYESDGLVLFLGTMFAPTKDRFGPGQGFTHAIGDIVTIATPKLGALVNRVNHTDKIAPWTFGVGALMGNLARRGLL